MKKKTEYKRKYRRVKAFVIISPPYEGSNIYMPGGHMAVCETIADAEDLGARWDEIVPCTITYPIRACK